MAGLEDIRDWIAGSFRILVVTGFQPRGFEGISPHPGFNMFTNFFQCTKKRLDRFSNNKISLLRKVIAEIQFNFRCAKKTRPFLD